jgi:FKBP-type peptidyl-prolyl cis-trans isomerase FkpA
MVACPCRCHNQQMVRVRGFLSSLIVAGLVVLAAGASACTDAPTTPTTTAPYTQTDLRVGTGADAVTGGVLQVAYTGWLYDAAKPDRKGLQFDSSVGRTTTFAFTLGAGQVIRGWDNGVAGMKVGGIRRLVIPPSLAYGGTRSGPIPPNVTLVFDIELLAVQ